VGGGTRTQLQSQQLSKETRSRSARCAAGDHQSQQFAELNQDGKSDMRDNTACLGKSPFPRTRYS
jgi:hypothetical protein